LPRGAATVGLHADRRQRIYRGQDRHVRAGSSGRLQEILSGLGVTADELT
jgi:hypothetical protein